MEGDGHLVLRGRDEAGRPYLTEGKLVGYDRVNSAFTP